MNDVGQAYEYKFLAPGNFRLFPINSQEQD